MQKRRAKASWERLGLLVCRLSIALLISRLITSRRIGRLVPRLECLRAHEALLRRLAVELVTNNLRLPPGR